MAIRQCIKFFRRQKGMTQKQLDRQLGFLGRTSDVRMAQYESKTGVPRQALVNMMAKHPRCRTTDPYCARHRHILRTDTHPLCTGKYVRIQNIRKRRGNLPCWKTGKSAGRNITNGVIPIQNRKPSGINEPTQKTVITPHVCEERRCTMPDIETYYLIDFENVNNAGLACSKQLGSHDHIHIFSTKNAPNISIESLTTFNDTDFYSHIIPTGKQSLDMHLIAYLGYLIGKNASQKCKYIIVSKDNDYDNIISFFKTLSSSTITRQIGLEPTPQKTTATKATPKSSKKTSSTKKTQLNTEIQKILSKASYNNEIISSVASLICKHHNEKNAKQVIYSSIVAKYGQEQGLNIYNHIKKSL